jgi:hypothetical protein
MVARIQIRRDTSADWTSTNPTLSQGELGYETNTDKFKIGDGATTWNNLGYVIYTPSFSDILSRPTTIAGYGITDAFSGSFGDLTGKPTTLAGYGITDALTTVSFAQVTNKPSTLSGYGITDAFNGSFIALTGKPTTISGYGITDAFNGIFSALTGKPTTIAGYGITDAFSGVFADLTNKPTTVSGYGITDALTSVSFAQVTNKPNTVAGYGITDAFSGAFAALTGKPTTLAGYGITDAAPIASPSFTGVAAAPTPALATNTTQLATTAFVTSKVQEAVGTSQKIYFQDNAPTTFSAFDEIWIDTNSGALYKQVAGTTIAPLDSRFVSNSSSSITIPAQGASDTRLVLSTGLPTGTVDIDPPLFLEAFSSTGVNVPTIGVVTYHDNTTQVMNQSSFTRSSGNAFDKKVKSFTYTSTGTSNSATSHITLTVSGVPEWQIQESHVQAKIDAIIDSAPGALDTLNELAAAINDDASFASTVTNNLSLKAPLTSPALTGTPTAPTATAGTNSTQIATTAFVNNKIELTDLSVTQNSSSGTGALSYNNSTGVFSYTPPASVNFANLTGKPTTVAGYGITDALTTGADADIGSNDFITTGKVYFANMFSQVANLPSATTYHGMFAHVHATGAAYFAHGGNWVRLANQSEVFSGTFSSLTGKPTTLTGYGITDAASLASPTFTGTPSGPTATSGTNTTQFATTAFVQSAISGFSAGANVSVSGSAPSSPSAGDLWFDDDALVLYVYYADGSSNQWVQTNPSSIDQSGFDGAFSSLSGKPTTLSGYGITDAATANSPTFSGTPVAPTASSGTNTTQLATTAFVQQEVSSAGGYNNANVDTHLNKSTAATGEVLSWNGSDYDWVSNSGAAATWTEKTSSYTAVAGNNLIVDTSSAVTITLPTSATLGDEVRIIDGTGNAGTNSITIARNGHKIQGATQDLTVSTARAAFGLVYYNAAQGWLLTER